MLKIILFIKIIMIKKNIIEAVCVITNSKKIKGYIILKEDLNKKDTIISINLSNVPPGKHGFHIHTSGDLRDGCKSLCSHYNPHNKTHGDIKSKNRHIGDLGNIQPNKYGVVKKILRDKLIKLRGKYSVIGRSIIIHSDEDDLGLGNNKESLKTGNAGKRIACGVIGYSRNCK